MPEQTVQQQKQQKRAEYTAIRQSVAKQEKKQLDLELQSRFLALPEYYAATVVFAYVAKAEEIETRGIIKAAFANNKLVAVPKCSADGKTLEFYYISGLHQLAPGGFGVLEPKPDVCKKVEDYSGGICAVPGLAFSTEGCRLGYGKGYYDRFLKIFGGVKVGLAASSCIGLKLPTEVHDIPVDIIITEKYVRRV
ncbi:MAG: 5-formyltetrahydrofolate cyclo-ligase [Oscillospiraceae bacterium]|jgi:5-formyltetrahydrofolate cyclo-ligase|nr:5-formyltetrahydrofolate cyclo-ligase [Oscillospiraceae bacterium]